MQARSLPPDYGSGTVPVATGARRQRVLFVDDEESILAGLRAVLRPQRREWDMVFALGGPAGLEEVQSSKFDVVPLGQERSRSGRQRLSDKDFLLVGADGHFLP